MLPNLPLAFIFLLQDDRDTDCVLLNHGHSTLYREAIAK